MIKKNESERVRIGILDGFRVLAILSVILFHYFSLFNTSRGTKELYPYGDDYDYFRYGYLGVQFFFMISGFVIFFTLENTSDFFTFWKKRLIRLLPSILIASLLIYLFFSFTEYFGFVESNGALNDVTAKSKNVLNFIPSVTFIKPELLNTIFESLFSVRLNFNYLDGSFWSLWVEIQFYFYISVIYFMSKLNFVRNFVFISAFLIISNLVFYSVGGSNILGIPYATEISSFYTKWIILGFNFLDYLSFFVIGMLFYILFKNNTARVKNSFLIKLSFVFFVFLTLLIGRSNEERISYILMFILFLTFIYYPKRLRILEVQFFRINGEASYFLYLIHQIMGYYLIVAFGSYFYPLGFLAPLGIMILFACVSVIYYEHVDSKINRYLKNKFLTIKN